MADVELTAVTVDEGIGGYREETMDAASDLAATLGVRHEIVAFTDLFGKTLDTMVKGEKIGVHHLRCNEAECTHTRCEENRGNKNCDRTQP